MGIESIFAPVPKVGQLIPAGLLPTHQNLYIKNLRLDEYYKLVDVSKKSAKDATIEAFCAGVVDADGEQIVKSPADRSWLLENIPRKDIEAVVELIMEHNKVAEKKPLSEFED